MGGGDGGSPGDFEERSHWVEFGEGGVSVSELYGRDAEGPDVTASVVGRVQLLLAGDHLQHQHQGTETHIQQRQETLFLSTKRTKVWDHFQYSQERKIHIKTSRNQETQ